MSDAEDEYDALPNIYSDIDFSSVPYLSGRGSSSDQQHLDEDARSQARSASPAHTAGNASDFAFDDLDEATLSQLDAIEAAFVATLPGEPMGD